MRHILLLLASCIILCGCKKESAENASENTSVSTPVVLQLNWKPEPQFGGFYAGNVEGVFARHGLAVDVREGGKGAPTIQMLAANQVEFGIVSADEIVTARSKGNDVVGLFAVYQTCPQGLMTRKSRGFKKIGDIFKAEGTVAMERGLTYALLMESKFGFGKVKIVPSPFGNLSVYQSDPNYAMQCFVTSEPLAAKKVGAPEPQTFLIADAGYNPYTTVLAINGKRLTENPDVAKHMVAAVRESWEAYLKDPKRTNAAMGELNPTMDAATFEESAKVQIPLIQTPDTQTSKLGVMTDARWKTLIDQMVEFKAIDSAVQPGDCYKLVD